MFTNIRIYQINNLIIYCHDSEPNPDVVPAPQAQASSSSPSSTPGDATASSAPQNSQDSIHLPPPPLPGHPAGAYQTVKRKGTVGPDELEGNLATLGGRPRSVEGLPAELRGARKRRHLDTMEFDPVSIYYKYQLVFFRKVAYKWDASFPAKVCFSLLIKQSS